MAKHTAKEILTDIILSKDTARQIASTIIGEIERYVASNPKSYDDFLRGGENNE